MAETVSIIMPAYNAEKYIAAAIESVLAQTYPNWELIVVDDGSTDATAETARRFAERDTRIRYFYQQNSRLGKARNTGIEKSSGTLIAFLDSDDLWLSEKLERQLRIIEEKKADVVFSDGFVFKEDDVTGDDGSFAVVHGKFEGRDLFDLLLIHNRIPVLSVLLRRSALDRAGLFEEGPAYHGGEDYDLWLRLARHGAVFYGMEERLVRYRRHSSAMTHRYGRALKPLVAVVRRHIGEGNLSEDAVRKKVRGMYRDLISALINEGHLSEAREYMREFSAWDKSGIVTSVQKVLLRFLPKQYNFISQECLYRTEWHLEKSFGKLKWR